MPKVITPIIDRIMNYVYPEPNSGCWLWTGRLVRTGYASLSCGGRKPISVHRYLFENKNGPIPAGLVCDHLCRVRSCVNPDHIEIVTTKENVVRGVGISAKFSARTHCNKGHPFSGDNLFLRRRGGVVSRGCRACKKEENRKQNAAKERLTPEAYSAAMRRGAATRRAMKLAATSLAEPTTGRMALAPARAEDVAATCRPDELRSLRDVERG